MKKYLMYFAVVSFAIPAIFAGGKKDAPPRQPEKPAIVRIAALNGPSSIPMAYLFENPPELEGVATAFEVAAGADVLLPRLIKGEVDIGILPVNVAAKVYTGNNGAVVLGAIVGEGMINLVTRDETVTSLEDLRGKRIYVAGQGATPDYLFRYLLKAHGIGIAETGAASGTVELDFSIPSAELAPALISGRISYAVVPEPFSTVVINAAPVFRRAIDFQKEFAALQHSVYPVSALVVRAETAKQYPETVRLFLKELEGAIAWTNANPAEAGELVQKHTLGLQAPIAARSIPTSAFRFIAAPQARPEIEKLLGIFLENDPSSIGGALPGEGFYFK
ncbi:MAG: ABC transporter substrate-binding protein [Treponema sp.]|jgi:NitT/TauT family transport system substrate-binding protein|nr:ABC transporter substrate-binding protein [Treponema sp.]